jgi:hypothetical protein
MTTPKVTGAAHWVPLVGPTMLVLDDDQWDALIEVLEVALATARELGDRHASEQVLRPMLEQFWGIRASLRPEEDDHPG